MGNIKFCINHSTRRVVNMKYCLCNECNFKRTHAGKSQFEVAKQKSLINNQKKKDNVSNVFSQRQIKPKKLYRFKISKKQQEIKKLLYIAYSEIDNERQPICTGCNKYQGGDIRLSHSHIISQADCKAIGKPELIYDKRDITFHCLDFGNNVGCHRKWESKDPKIMSTLLDYETNMAFINNVSKALFNKIVNK